MADLSQMSTADLLAAAGPSPETFAAQYAPVAQRAAQQIGVDPQVLLGQWGHETGWGKSVIPGTNNLGNIKDPTGQGPTATDNANGSKDSYASYQSPEDFADHYATLIKTQYPGAVGSGNDVQKFTKGLAGYAEDPSYAGHVAAAIKSVPSMPAAPAPAIAPAAAAGPDLSQMSTADLMAAAGLPPSPQTPAPQASPPLPGFLQGVGDFAAGATRAIVHGISGVANVVAPDSEFAKGAAASLPQMDAQMQANNAAYAKARAAQLAQQPQTGQVANPGTGTTTQQPVNQTDWARMAGQVAPSLALPMSGGGVIPAALSGAAGGALMGAVGTQPGQSYAGNMALGGAGGLAGGLAAGVAGNVIGGARLSPDAQRMVDMGVTPTPGQAAGGLLGSLEEKIGKTVPGVSEAVKGAQANATDQFNRAMYQNALAPLKAALPKTVATGSDGVEHVADTIGNAYQAIEPQVKFVPRGQFIQDVTGIRTDLAQNAPSTLDQFDTIVKNQIQDKLQNGAMNGSQWGDTRSTISGIARNQRLGNSTPDNRTLADALDNLNEAVNQQVYRNSPPGIQPQLQAANSAWARYKQIESAAGAASGNGNIFTAAQYAGAVKKGSTAFQKGTNSGLNADIAASAQNVLGQKIANSGTPERSAAIGVPAAIGGLLYTGHPALAAGALGGIGAGIGAYGTQVGRQAMLSAIFQRPELMRQFGSILSGAGPQAGAVAGNAAVRGQ